MEVDPAGAAAAAGIKKGDAIIKINDVPVSTNSELSEQVARQKPGDKLVITFLRGNEEKTATAVLKNKLGTFASQKEAIIESLGAKLSGLNKEDATKMGIAGGVQVTDIQDGIIANQTNMRAGFVITKVGGMAVRSVDELKDVLSTQDGNFQIEGLYPGNKTVYYYGINDFNK
jgi:S1-C subfamily serine protease